MSEIPILSNQGMSWQRPTRQNNMETQHSFILLREETLLTTRSHVVRCVPDAAALQQDCHHGLDLSRVADGCYVCLKTSKRGERIEDNEVGSALDSQNMP